MRGCPDPSILSGTGLPARKHDFIVQSPEAPVIAHALLWLRNRPISFLLVSLIVVVPLMVISCSGVNNTMQSPNTGTINVSLNDAPSCIPTTGHFTHVFITVQSVEVHTSATAGDSSAGWQELAPQLASAPQQIDLFSQANTNCVLAQLGSASLPVGSLQQIDRKSTRLNSSHTVISYAVFCLKKKKTRGARPAPEPSPKSSSLENNRHGRRTRAHAQR